jgi:hypothetical protein
MFKFITNLFKNAQVPQCDKTAVRERCVDFATWIQDNYSPNTRQGGIHPLPKGKYRKDFTDDIYTISELYDVYNAI